jgi:hypothetical protein
LKGADIVEIKLNSAQAKEIIKIINVGDQDNPEFTQGYIGGIMDVLSILQISLKDISNLSKETIINTK